jgi:hypothetical protein
MAELAQVCLKLDPSCSGTISKETFKSWWMGSNRWEAIPLSQEAMQVLIRTPTSRGIGRFHQLWWWTLFVQCTWGVANHCGIFVVVLAVGVQAGRPGVLSRQHSWSLTATMQTKRQLARQSFPPSTNGCAQMVSCRAPLPNAKNASPRPSVRTYPGSTRRLEHVQCVCSLASVVI